MTRIALLGVAVLLAATAGPVRAESDVAHGIMGDWSAKPFVWRTGRVKGCRYRQAIHIERRVGPGRFVGSYRARTACATRAWTLHGRIVVTVSGRTVKIDSDTAFWIVETVRYVSPERMVGADARGNPLVYRRPRGLPTS
jgi:hypothetical protein